MGDMPTSAIVYTSGVSGDLELLRSSKSHDFSVLYRVFRATVATFRYDNIHALIR